MNERLLNEIDKMLDGNYPDISVMTKYQNSIRGGVGPLMIMAQIAQRAVERKGKKKATPKDEE